MGLADRDEEFRLPTGRGDEFARGGGPDPQGKRKQMVAPRDMFVPDLQIGQTSPRRSRSGVTPPIARRSADNTCEDAREMALVRESAGDGHFGERGI